MILNTEITVNLNPPTAKGSTVAVALILQDRESKVIERCIADIYCIDPDNAISIAFDIVQGKNPIKGYSFKIRHTEILVSKYKVLGAWLAE